MNHEKETMNDYINAADMPAHESIKAVADIVSHTVKQIYVGKQSPMDDEALTDSLIAIASQALETRDSEALFTAVIETASQLIYRVNNFSDRTGTIH